MNPYHYWLGYPEYFHPQTHYDLLGLSSPEWDMNRIAQAADMLISRVQNAPHGGFIMEWQQLIMQLQQAKSCLCNPASKAQYDAKCGFSQAASRPAPMPSAGSYPTNLATPFSQAPTPSAGAYPTNLATPFPSAPAPPAGNNPMWNQASSPGTPAQLPSSAFGTSYPAGNSYSPQPPQAPTPSYSSGYQPPSPPVSPPATPYGTVSSPGYSTGNAYPPEASYAPQPPQAPVPSYSSGYQPPSPPVSPPATPYGTVSSPGYSTGNAYSAETSSPAGTTGAANSPVSSSGTASAMKNLKQMYAGSIARQRLMIALLLAVVLGLLGYILYANSGGPSAGGTKMASAGASGEADDEDAIPEKNTEIIAPVPTSSESTGTAPKVTKKPGGEEKTDPSVVIAAEKSASPAFRQACNDIRADLAQRDIPTVRQHLAAAEKAAVSAAEKKELARLAALTDRAENFQEVLATAMSKFPPASTMKWKGKTISIYESGYGMLGFKMEGKQNNFTSKNLTPEVVELILQKVEEKGSALDVDHGAYLVLGGDESREKARNLWNRAKARGEDVALLLPELDTPIRMDAGIAADASEKKSASEGTAGESAADVNVVPDEMAPIQSPETAQEEATKTFLAENAPAGEEKTAVSGKTSAAGAGGTKTASAGASGEADEDAVSKKTSEKTDSDTEDSVVDKKKQDTFRKLMQGIREDLGYRNVRNAKKKLSEAKNLFQTQEEAAEYERLDALTEYMQEFVTWVNESMRMVNSPAEANIGGEIVFIVEADPGKLKIKIEGRLYDFTVENLTMKLAEFLLGGSVNETPDNRVLYGTYLAMAPNGDRARARKLWDEAGKLGFDTSLLMPELDVPLAVSPGRQPAGNTGGFSSGTGKTQSAASRTPVPSDAEQKSALEKIKTSPALAKNYEKISDAKTKELLTAQLLKQAAGASVPAAERYVMLQETAVYAQQTGAYLRAFDALQQLEQRFETETYAQRMALISEAEPKAAGSAMIADLVEMAIRQGKDACVKKNVPDAKKLYGIAQRSIKKAASTKPTLNTSFKELEKMISGM